MSEMQSNFNKLYHLLGLLNEKKTALQVQKKINRDYEDLKLKYNNLSHVLLLADSYLKQLNLTLERAKQEDRAYKNRRIGFIEDSIARNLKILFPEETIIPKLKPTVLRKKSILSLVLVDKHGNTHTPSMYAGGMMKSAISYAASMSIINLIGTNKVYIDEAFGLGSKEKKAEMGEVLRDYLNQNVQVLLISQGTELFQNLPRREFHLYKNPQTEEVEMESVLDLGV